MAPIHWFRSGRVRAAVTAAALSLALAFGSASAQPKPAGAAGGGGASSMQVPEGVFAGPVRDGKAHGTGRLTLRSGLTVEGAEYDNGALLGFVLCNPGDTAVFGALAWRDGEDWTSKGWYRIDPKQCNVPWSGRIDRRYLAYHVDVGGRAVVAGDFFFCVHASDSFEVPKNTVACPTGMVRRGFALADLGDGSSRRGGVLIEIGAAGGQGATPTPPVPPPASTGTLEFAESTYTGEIRDGKANGRGVMTYKNGARIEGMFVDNVPNGPAVWIDKDKNKWTGTFKDGLLTGKVRIDWNDGTVLDAADMEQGRILGLAVCNPRAGTVFGAVGYRDGDNWMAKGWYRIEPNQCIYLRQGRLEQRYWYYRLIGGGAEVKGGEHQFCVHRENAFEMKDGDQCPPTGERAGFTQIDLGEGSARKVGFVTDAPR